MRLTPRWPLLISCAALTLACSSGGGGDAGPGPSDAGDAGGDAGPADGGDAGSDGGIGYTLFACADAGAGSAFDRAERFTAADGTTVQITVCGPQAGSATTSYGPGDGGFAAADFAHAVAVAVDAGAGTLLIANGTYDFGPPAADAGSNAAIVNAHDLIIDGQGSTLVFHGLLTGLTIARSQRLLLRNFNIDWGERLAIGGALQNGVAACSGKLAFVAGASYPQDDNAPLPIYALSVFDVAKPGWPLVPFQQAHWSQTPSLRPVYAGAQTYCIGTPQGLATSPIASGTPAIALARMNGQNGILVTSSSDVSMENVTVFAAPAEAFTFDNSGRGIRMSRCRVTRNTSDPLRLIASNADGVNFRQTLGSVLLEDSEFADQGDDGVSVVGMFFSLQPASTKTSLTLAPQTAAAGVVAGDLLQVVDSTTFAKVGEAVVALVTPLRDGGVTLGAQVDLQAPGIAALALDAGQSVAGELLDGGLLAQVPSRSSPNFLLRNVSLHDNDQRGILIHGQNGLIDNCHLANNLGMILMAQDSVFLEGPGAQNVIVQNSEFDNCDVMAPTQTAWACAGGSQGSAPPAPLTIDSITAGADYPFGAPDSTIVLRNNVIRGAAGAGIVVGSTTDVTLIGNELFDTNQTAFDAGCGRLTALPVGSIVETEASNVSLSGNVRDGGSTLGIAIDPSCRSCPTQTPY